MPVKSPRWAPRNPKVAVDTPIITDLVQLDSTEVRGGKVFIPPHLHHYHQLEAILAGHVTISVEAQTPLRAGAGDALLIPPLLKHSFEQDKGYRVVSFKFHLSADYWRLFGFGFHHWRLSRSLLQCVESSARRWVAGAPLARQQCLAMAVLCVIESLQEMSHVVLSVDELDSFRRGLWPLLERVAGEPYASWSVASLAAECHLSPNYFSKCFNAVFGQTVQRYLLEARVRAAAAELLTDSQRPIKEVAEKSKYASIHAFSRVFKQVIGSSPAKYRRARHDVKVA